MLSYRKATLADAKIYFEWTNEEEVRKQSFSSTKIDYESHVKWFEAKLKDVSCFMYLFKNQQKEKVGQVRIQKEGSNEALIGISLAKEQRGKGYANEMLLLATDLFLKENSNFCINAYIKYENISSKAAFEKARFELINIITYENFKSFHFQKKHTPCK
jgi:RimJ/RimL family protein N-acetyltransferase